MDTTDNNTEVRFTGTGICRLQIEVAIIDHNLADAVLAGRLALKEAEKLASKEEKSPGRKNLQSQEPVHLPFQLPSHTFPWKITVSGDTLWKSNRYNELIPTGRGTYVGEAHIYVIKLLEALVSVDETITVARVIEIAKNPSEYTAHGEASKIYGAWRLHVITDGTSDWKKAIEMPINMGISDGGR